MADTVTITVNGAPVTVPAGATVATAVALAGIHTFRRSVTGEPRAPLCGMGVCFECCVTIGGRAHVRSCQTACTEGLEVTTDA
ncbi:MAG: (2Fe-2S)-binding protein [Bryobacteraceae bacterium]